MLVGPSIPDDIVDDVSKVLKGDVLGRIVSGTASLPLIFQIHKNRSSEKKVGIVSVVLDRMEHTFIDGQTVKVFPAAHTHNWQGQASSGVTNHPRLLHTVAIFLEVGPYGSGRPLNYRSSVPSMRNPDELRSSTSWVEEDGPVVGW